MATFLSYLRCVLLVNGAGWPVLHLIVVLVIDALFVCRCLQEGTLHIQTEMGLLDVAPKEIVVIQRGIRFRVDVDGPSRGYICVSSFRFV